MSYPDFLPVRHESFNRIKLLCMDVDGVLTDGGLYYGPEGIFLNKFNVLDGQGLKLIKNSGIITCFVTMSDSGAVRKRAQDLRVDYCLTNIQNKEIAVEKILIEINLCWSQVMYIGDDINDMGLLKRVGIAIAVSNAVDPVIKISNYITRKSGGQGAIREVCDALLESRNCITE